MLQLFKQKIHGIMIFSTPSPAFPIQKKKNFENESILVNYVSCKLVNPDSWLDKIRMSFYISDGKLQSIHFYTYLSMPYLRIGIDIRYLCLIIGTLQKYDHEWLSSLKTS